MRKEILMIGVLTLALTGCNISSVDSDSTADTAAVQKSSDAENGTSEEETGTGEKEDTTAETETELNVLPEDDRNITEKYLALMEMDIEEAREYFGVKELPELTSDDFDAFLSEVFVNSVSTDRYTVNQYMAKPEDYGVDIELLGYDLGSIIVSEDDKKYIIDVALEELTELLAYPYDKLNNRQKLVFDKMYYEELLSIWSTEVKDYSSAVANSGGVVPNLATAFYEFTFSNEEDVITYNRVMEYVPDYILEVYTSVQKSADELGFYPTDSMLNDNIDAIKELLNMKNNPFIEAYNVKIDALGLDKKKAEEYKENNKKFYEDEVVPALDTLERKLKGFLGKNKDNTLPINLDGGKEYYEFAFENALGAQITVEEGFELLTKKTVAAYEALNKSVIMCYDEYMDYYNGALPTDYDGLGAKEIVDKLVKELNGVYPALGDVEYDVTVLPKSLEIDGVLAYYLVPRIDTAELNVMRYNSASLGDNVIDMITTLAHEGYPGHMLQFNLEHNSDCYPVEQLLSHLGYSEGWAMYVVKDTYNTMGISKALAKTLRCDYDVNYYLMGLADIAFNGMGMTKDEFADFLSDNGFIGMESSVDAFFDAVTGDPATFVPYTLGKILASKTIDDYINDSGVTELAARESYCEIGPAPFKIVKKYLGTEF